jgi:hypothetical protein
MSPALTPKVMSVLFASGMHVAVSVGVNQDTAYPISFGINFFPLPRCRNLSQDQFDTAAACRTAKKPENPDTPMTSQDK